MSEDSSIVGSITMAAPTSTIVCSVDSRRIITITSDGRIEIGEGLTADEAGRQVVEGMRWQLDYIIKAAIAAERERCAKIADRHYNVSNLAQTAVCAAVAAEIRKGE